jgi:DNA-binding transcriptional ArsR family regulator
MPSQTPTTAADPTVLARVFRVLGDPIRLRIIERLEEGGHSVGEIVDAVGASQPRVSAHLACLRHCQFVETERRGREVVYRLSVPGLAELLRTAASVAAPRAEHLATCDRIGPEWI